MHRKIAPCSGIDGRRNARLTKIKSSPTRRALCLLFILPALALGAAGCANPGAKPRPQAVNGVIDLAGWDFEKDGPLDLAGEWKYVWEETSPEFTRPAFDDSGWDTFRVPNYWNDEGHASEGFAWFRLKMTNLARPGSKLGISMKTMETAGRMYIDGQEVMHDGTPGITRESTVPCTLPQTALLPQAGVGTVVIAWNIANFHEKNGGPRFGPVLGLYRQLTFAQWLLDLRDMLVSGAILMMGAYSLILWFLRRRDRINLFFAALCLVLAVRIILLGGFIQRLFPDADIFDVRLRVEALATLLIVFFCIKFFARLFPEEFFKPLLSFSSWLLIAAGVPLAILPCWITNPLVPIFDGLIAVYYLWVIVCVVLAIRHRRAGAKFVLGGLILFAVTVANDIVYTSTPALYSLNLFGPGSLCVIVCYATILSYRFARAHALSEALSQNLRMEVERQTAKISDQNRELEKLVRERTDSFINFNHEIKTPLTLIGLHLDKALAERGDDDNLAVVRHNLDKLKRDVTNCLDLEKLIRHQAFYDHRRPLAVAAVVREKVELFRPLAEARGLILDLAGDGAASGLFARIDAFALDRVINNLLDNAIRYTERGGRITVGLDRRDGYIELSVADTGAGIPAAALENIFEPYYQVRNKKRSLQGMGMGLNIVKRIVTEIGGAIHVASRERAGTSFTISLPACAPPAAEEAAAAAPALSRPLPPTEIRLRPETYHEDKDTLLVVDDNTGMIALLQECLAAEYNVYYARSGREAVDKLETMPAPELILSDIMMDEMDGYEFLDLVVRSEDYRSIPLVFVTARSLPQDTLEGLVRGAVDVIRKPFSAEELKAKIASLVRQRKAEREAVIREVRQKMERLPANGYSPEELDRLREENYRRFKITKREREIIRLLTTGLEYKEISDRLTLSLNTIKPYIRDIYKKCGINNRTELIGIFRLG